MKKILINLLCAVFLFSIIPIKVDAEEFTTSNESFIEELEERGYEVRKVSTNEVIQLLAEKNNLSEIEVVAKYGNELYERQIYDHYVISKNHSLYFTDGAWGTSASHNVICKIYSSGSFREVYHVYDSYVLLGSGDFTWEDGGESQSYTSTSITWFNDGNLVLTVSYSLGASYKQYFSGSIGSNYYYRKYFPLESYMSMY